MGTNNISVVPRYLAIEYGLLLHHCMVEEILSSKYWLYLSLGTVWALYLAKRRVDTVTTTQVPSHDSDEWKKKVQSISTYRKAGIQ